MKKSLTIAAVTFTTFLAITATASAEVTAVSAQQGLTTFAGLITTFNNTVVKALATLALSGAVVAFFFGVVKFIWGLREGKTDAITNGKQFMIWSLVGLFAMFSVYGIIKVAQSLVPGLSSSTITIPEINYGGNGLGGAAPISGASPANPLGGAAPIPGANGGTPIGSAAPIQTNGNNGLGSAFSDPQLQAQAKAAAAAAAAAANAKNSGGALPCPPGQVMNSTNSYCTADPNANTGSQTTNTSQSCFNAAKPSLGHQKCDTGYCGFSSGICEKLPSCRVANKDQAYCEYIPNCYWDDAYNSCSETPPVP